MAGEVALSALGVGVWAGVALYRVASSEKADIVWFNGKVTKVVRRGVGSATVKIFFDEGDNDNDIEWIFQAEAFAEDDSAIQLGRKQKKSHPFAWRTYAAEAEKQRVVKVMVKEDLITVIGGLPRRTGYVPLDTLSYSDLVAIIDGVGIPKHCFASKPMARVEDTDDAEEVVARPSKKPKDTRTTAEAVTKKPPADFTAYKKEMNTRLKQIEDQVKTLAQSQSALKHEIGKLKKEKQVAVSNSVAAKKDNMFAKIALINGVDASKPVYNDMCPGVRDGTKKTFPQPLNYPRCVRYLHTSETSTACASAHMGNKEFLFNKRPTAVPLAIMELDPKLAKLVGAEHPPKDDSARVPSLANAHERWYMYVTCLACVNSITDLKFVTWQSGVKNIEEGVWSHCAVCHNGNGIHRAAGAVPVCEKCHTDIAKDGNDQNGDDRSLSMRSLQFRFPWLLFQWNDGIRWRDMFKRSEALVNSIRGPDTVFAVQLQEVGKKVWIVLEEDGNGHSDAKYQEDEEYNRMVGIVQSLLDKGGGDHVFFVRYTPKGRFKTSSDFEAEPDKTLRLLVVRSWVCWFLVQLLQKKECAKTMVLYIFYDFANRHFQRAKRNPPEDWRVGWTCTFPQDVVGDDTAYDWRYALNPNEGVIFNVVGGNDGLFKVAAAEAFD